MQFEEMEDGFVALGILKLMGSTVCVQESRCLGFGLRGDSIYLF